MHPLVLLERRLALEHLLAEAALELGLLVLAQVLAQVGGVGAPLLAVAALVLLKGGDSTSFKSHIGTYMLHTIMIEH